MRPGGRSGPAVVIRAAIALHAGQVVPCKQPDCPKRHHRLLAHAQGGFYVHCPRAEVGSYRY